MSTQILADCGYLIVNIQEYIESGNKEKAKAHLRVLHHILLSLAGKETGKRK